MDFHEALARLTGSVIFKEWYEQHKNYFLAHGFRMLDEANKDSWQIGFYGAGSEQIKTFIVSPTIVEPMQEQDILKQGEIQKLIPDEIKISADEALAKAQEIFKKHKEPALKTFFIIQKSGEKTIYNITYFTQSFHTINIHVSAEDGKILSENRQKLLDFA